MILGGGDDLRRDAPAVVGEVKGSWGCLHNHPSLLKMSRKPP